VAEAWKMAEAGPAVVGSDRILFRTWSALCAVLTPKRYEHLRHLRQMPETGIRALARELGRDVRRVHEDVVALVELGPVARSGSLSSQIDAIISTIRISE
jgi:predicted transcriptional regulator